jgi:hypothetical protein
MLISVGGLGGIVHRLILLALIALGDWDWKIFDFTFDGL